MTVKIDLVKKANWVRAQTLLMHKTAPGVRIASSLSPVEIFTSLFYGGLMQFRPNEPQWPDRDRLVLSKGHGSLAIYPVLADLGYIELHELERVGQPQSRLGIIPEPITPGIETTNGSLGHGLGVACGMAIALKQLKKSQTIFVLCGDGEMNSGAIWEAVMFAARQKLDNLVVIVDDNKRSMLGYQKDIMGLDPLTEKLEAFGWSASEVDGHDVDALQEELKKIKDKHSDQPKALVAHTVKGHMVPELEADPICHIRVVAPEVIDKTLKDWS